MMEFCADNIKEDRKSITNRLSCLLERHIDPTNDVRIYWAKEVTFDYSTNNAFRVDYMLFKPLNNSVSGIEKGDVYCYEVKSSLEDFNSKNGHNFIGDFNYYVMPEVVYESVKNKMPYNIGVYIPTKDDCLKMIKKARRQNRSRPVSEVLLMMYRSSRRDFINCR